MHGVILATLHDFVTAVHGRDAAAELFAGEPSYLLTESYPDERLLALVSRASAMTGADEAAVVHDFGVFAAAKTFPSLYPAFYAIAGSAREFLLTFETRIHELVRATIPNAIPPRLTVTSLGDDGVEILYDSPRQLCVLLRGLVEGTASYYGESVASDEVTCMHKGDDACRFEVRLAPKS